MSDFLTVKKHDKATNISEKYVISFGLDKKDSFDKLRDSSIQNDDTVVENDNHYVVKISGTLPFFGTYYRETITDVKDYHNTKQVKTFISETYEEYLAKKVSIEDKTLTWIYNIIEGKKESDRIIHDEQDFIIIPSFHWNQLSDPLQDIHLMAIVKDKTLMSIRDLRQSHIPLLESIRTIGLNVIETKYGLTSNMVQITIHYPPSTFLLHVHFSHINAKHAGTSVNICYRLDDIIKNLGLCDTYYHGVMRIQDSVDFDAKIHQSFLGKRSKAINKVPKQKPSTVLPEDTQNIMVKKHDKITKAQSVNQQQRPPFVKHNKFANKGLQQSLHMLQPTPTPQLTQEYVTSIASTPIINQYTDTNFTQQNQYIQQPQIQKRFNKYATAPIASQDNVMNFTQHQQHQYQQQQQLQQLQQQKLQQYQQQQQLQPQHPRRHYTKHNKHAVTPILNQDNTISFVQQPQLQQNLYLQQPELQQQYINHTVPAIYPTINNDTVTDFTQQNPYVQHQQQFMTQKIYPKKGLVKSKPKYPQHHMKIIKKNKYNESIEGNDTQSSHVIEKTQQEPLYHNTEDSVVISEIDLLSTDFTNPYVQHQQQFMTQKIDPKTGLGKSKPKPKYPRRSGKIIEEEEYNESEEDEYNASIEGNDTQSSPVIEKTQQEPLYHNTEDSLDISQIDTLSTNIVEKSDNINMLTEQLKVYQEMIDLLKKN